MYYADRPMYYVGISMYDAETPTADTAVAACRCGESGVIEETDAKPHGKTENRDVRRKNRPPRSANGCGPHLKLMCQQLYHYLKHARS